MTTPGAGQSGVRSAPPARDTNRVIVQRPQITPPAAPGPLPQIPRTPGVPALGQPGGLNRGPSATGGAARPTVGVPPASFRGPEAGRNLTAITPQMQQRTAQQLMRGLRQQNAGRLVTPKPGVTRDSLGNLIPRNARMLNPIGTTVGRSFRNVIDRVGLPNHPFAFRPRPGGWDGGPGGWHGGHNWNWNDKWRHNPSFVFGFFFPFYWSDAFWFGWWYPGFYPSIYSYWGWGPGWIYPDQAYYQPPVYSYPSYSYPTYNYYGYSGTAAAPAYTLDTAGVEQAIADLRAAWVNSDISLLANHLTDQLDLQVYFDGKYTYTTTTSNYYAMTADTMALSHTVEMTLDTPVWISANEVFYTGTHVYQDPAGEQHTVYLSYRLRQIGSGWYIVAVGSSTQPIQSEYKDFRYR